MRLRGVYCIIAIKYSLKQRITSDTTQTSKENHWKQQSQHQVSFSHGHIAEAFYPHLRLKVPGFLLKSIFVQHTRVCEDRSGAGPDSQRCFFQRKRERGLDLATLPPHFASQRLTWTLKCACPLEVLHVLAHFSYLHQSF